MLSSPESVPSPVLVCITSPQPSPEGEGFFPSQKRWWALWDMKRKLKEREGALFSPERAVYISTGRSAAEPCVNMINEDNQALKGRNMNERIKIAERNLSIPNSYNCRNNFRFDRYHALSGLLDFPAFLNTGLHPVLIYVAPSGLVNLCA